ncbi:MAG: DUF3656 domain-containing protein, partial [Bryobacteraceae bacterium]|nr:DUF3656 domain-containing protein [Bryobacteraceae bacterium]
MANLNSKPEIMSPAGYWPQLHAAIDSGADSVYFGLKHFTARAKVGFSLEELPEVMRTLHRRGVKGFVTFNTLIFDHELEEAIRTVAKIAEAGADALIVQDFGMLRLIHNLAPALELHASTQMSITDAQGVRLAARAGARRVTLARELSLEEIAAIRRDTETELEIFVHGALCVAYSGQCFSSEAWGGRSANRGQCAQACRLPYELIVDGEQRPLGDARYLLSPGDLYALHHIPQIVETGIAALKIEGRYKDADYVALATRAYRQAVDEAFAGRPVSITPKEELRLEQVYSRGLGPHFVTGTNHQTVVNGRAPRHRGVLMGRVAKVLSAALVIETFDAHSLAPLKPGDGVVLDAAGWRSPEEPEEGGRVYQIDEIAPRRVELRFGNREVNFSRVRPGDLLWRTHDPDLDKAVKAIEPRRQPVDIHVRAAVGQPLTATWSGPRGVSVTVHSPEPLVPAQHRGADEAHLREQFARLGNTPFELRKLELHTEGRPFAPASLLNALRREAVEQLLAKLAEPPAPALRDPAAVLAAARPRAHGLTANETEAVHLLVRSPEQLDAALQLSPSTITLDYLDLYGLKPSVERVRDAAIAVRVAAPRIIKPGEERVVDFLRRLDCPVLVRSTGLIEMLRPAGQPLFGDFSLNTANAVTGALYLEMGLERLTPTHDLNAEQIAALAEELGPARIEAIAYQHLPVFHTEHCVFCRFLSTGTTYKDCGRPCEQHRVALKDAQGREHPVL